MDFIVTQDISVAKFYLGFFAVSLLILGVILLSGLPALCKGTVKAFHLLRARRDRQFRMLDDPSALKHAGECLKGMTLFEREVSDLDPDQDDDGAPTRFISDAA
jgi:hypothetical protein